MVNRIFLVFSLGLISTSLSSELRLCEDVICSEGLKCCETSDGTQTCCSENAKCCNIKNGCCSWHTTVMNYIIPNHAFKEVGKKRFAPPFLKTDTDKISKKDLMEIENRIMDDELDPNHNMNSQLNLVFSDIKNLEIDTGAISTQTLNKVAGLDSDKISKKDLSDIKNGTDNEPFPNHNMNSQLNLIFVDLDNLTIDTGDISLQNLNKLDGIDNELNATRNMNFNLNLIFSNISNVHIKTGNISMKRSNVVQTKAIDNELDVDNDNSFRSLKRNLGRRWKLDIFCPGRKQKCPRSYTCCLMADETYGCCPYSEAVCCSDFAHCCPSTTVCNVTSEACAPF